jgi:glyoxylase-like metal-dependent hydrolase (beta-lactamase superfamily II)
MTSPAFTLGRYEARVVSAGALALDGGAMFGIIPKPLWEKKVRVDVKNRIDLGLNVLLLRDGARTVVVDTGMGDKWSDKQRDQFKVTDTLLSELAAVGVNAADVTDVVQTHLHFDHAGGTTRRAADGSLHLTFENARVHVGRRNWEHAHAPSERDRGSYLRDSWAPLDDVARDQLVLVDDENGRAQVLPELEAIVCEGHTTGQLLPLVGVGRERVLYGADMVPTRAHVRVAWNMGYDLRPIDLMREKRALLALCADEGIALVYEHDPDVCATAIAKDGDDFQPAEAPVWARAAIATPLSVSSV